MEGVVGVARERERGEAREADLDAELLGELAHERLLGRLAGADLAAWELPQPGHRLALRAACDEHPVVAIDQGGSGDKEEGRAIGKVVREPARQLKSGPDRGGRISRSGPDRATVPARARTRA